MLKRVLSLNDVLISGVGYIIGGGIFTLISHCTKYSKGYTWLAFLITGIIIYLTSTSYDYISPSLTHAEAEYDIIEKEFGKHTATFFSSAITMEGLFIAATISMGMTNYLSKILGFKDTPFIKIAVSSLLIAICGLINLAGIKESINVASALTFVEVLALVVIAILGLKNINTKALSVKPTNTNSLLMSSLLMLFAYTGFEALPRLSEETINSQENIPKAIKYSIIVTTILYTLVSVATISILGIQKTASSRTPLSDIIQKLFGGGYSRILDIMALLSIGNTILMTNIVSSRGLYGLSKKIKPLEFFKTLSIDKQTPTHATVAVTLFSILLLVILPNIEHLAVFANFFVLIALFIINLLAIKLKMKRENEINIKSIIAGGSIFFYLIYIIFNLGIKKTIHFE
jgi:basic amino acid/polyamine antiporter, APA family